MSGIQSVLGMNARNLHYLRGNQKFGKEVADSKLKTKKLLKKKSIPHPKLLGIVTNASEIQQFKWNKLKEGFVIKPSEGLGGEGVLVIRKPSQTPGEWILMDGSKVRVDDLKLHVSDIIEGRYSRNRTPDQAFIEQRIKIHPKFLKYVHQGTPDVRVIVYNNIPVMAMLRLPTRQSGGKANLHQGAIGVGVDMATGITTYGIHANEIIRSLPESKRKLNGIKIPNWKDVLKVAIDVQQASQLEYVGVDIVIDQEKGPEVLEFNSQPGLQIQMANRTGLLARLKRVEGLEVSQPYKGIQIAEVLFAERFSDKVKIKEGRRIVGIFEKVKIKTKDGKNHEVVAKMDTGAFSVSVDKQLAKELGLLNPESILYEEFFASALGRQKRPIIEVEFWLQGKKIKAIANVADRKHLRAPMLVGRKYLEEFMVDPSRIWNY